MLNLSINSEKESQKIISFIRKTVQSAGFKKVIIGLSGGLDSSSSFVLAVKALGKENVFAVFLPFGDWHNESFSDVQELTERINFPPQNLITIDIKPLLSPLLTREADADHLRKGNMMVRLRMIILYDLAKKYSALVLGTENRTEYLLGYFTRFGDEASDIEPLRGLFKTQVKQLAAYLKLPAAIVRKAPTAGMWPEQTDEGEFGFTYEEADQVLFLAIDRKLSEKEIINKGFASDMVKKVLGRMKVNEFKHKLPYTR